MQTRMRIENPDKVELTLVVTMSVKEWDTVRDKLSGGNISCWQFTKAITDAFSQIRKIVYVEPNKE